MGRATLRSNRPPPSLIEWGEQHQDGFEKLKLVMISTPCLLVPVPDNPCHNYRHLELFSKITGAFCSRSPTTRASWSRGRPATRPPTMSYWPSSRPSTTFASTFMVQTPCPAPTTRTRSISSTRTRPSSRVHGKLLPDPIVSPLHSLNPGEDGYDSNCMLAHRYNQPRVLVRWTNYPGEDSWVPPEGVGTTLIDENMMTDNWRNSHFGSTILPSVKSLP